MTTKQLLITITTFSAYTVVSENALQMVTYSW